MNKNIIKAFALFGAVFSMSACTSDMEFKDSQVSAITQLYEPADGKSVTLQASATASTIFAWEAAKAEDSGSPLYEVVYDEQRHHHPQNPEQGSRCCRFQEWCQWHGQLVDHRFSWFESGRGNR